MRDKIRKLIEKHDKKNNIKVEKLIYQNSQSVSQKNGETLTTCYKSISYSILAMFLKKVDIKNIVILLENNRVFFDCEFFEFCEKDKRNKQELLIEPPQIEKGVNKCRCGSDMVFFFTSQSRSCDEASTNYFFCLGTKSDGKKCGRKWKE